MAWQRVYFRRPLVELDPYKLPYTRERSPGTRGKKRFDRICSTNPQQVLDGTDLPSAVSSGRKIQVLALQTSVPMCWMLSERLRCGEDIFRIRGACFDNLINFCKTQTNNILKYFGWVVVFQRITDIKFHGLEHQRHAAHSMPLRRTVFSGIRVSAHWINSG